MTENKDEEEQELETAAESQEIKKSMAQKDQQFHKIGDVMAETAQIFEQAHKNLVAAKEAICSQCKLVPMEEPWDKVLGH